MLVSSLVLSALLYGFGVARVWRAAGYGRGVRALEAAAFGCGWLTLVAALSSPLDELSETWLAAHMVQHELLMVIAAPLMAVSAPLLALLWVLPLRIRRRTLEAVRWRPIAAAWTVLLAPPTVWLLHALALWVWHLPSLYDYALEHESIHVLQHLCFFGTAAMFWWGLAHGRYGRVGIGAGVLYVFATALHGGVLGALLTFAPTVWYPPYLQPHAEGLTPLEDQQLAGLIMWIPSGIVFAVGGLVLFAAWLRESDRRTRFTSSALVGLLALCVHIGCGNPAVSNAENLTGGKVARGPAAMKVYGCESCHVIPGVSGATGLVGPPLTAIGVRTYLAGEVANTPENMLQWIRFPRQIEPRTAMPDTGVTESDGRDIAAYLYTLK
jgi:cytochrome c oxidase assembly factor CtaG/cytochrome c2